MLWGFASWLTHGVVGGEGWPEDDERLPPIV